MKRNSPGCTCCQPAIFGNQSLWALGQVISAREVLSYAWGGGGLGLELVGAVMPAPLPDWVIIVNSWGTVSHIDIDAGGAALTGNTGFNHEFAGMLTAREGYHGGFH